MKKLLVVIALLFVVACSSKSEEFPSDYQLRIIQATTQLVIKDYGYKDDTSSQLKDWEINANESGDTYRWNSITSTSAHGRIKVIFEWSGDDDEDLILKYFLISGSEIVNDLNK